MKLVPVLLLNVGTGAVALLIYDQARKEQAPQDRASMSRAADSATIERRLLALEAKLGSVTKEDDRDVYERLAALEDAADVPTALAARETRPIRRAEEAAPPPDDEPTEAEVRRFRRLQKAVDRENVIRKKALDPPDAGAARADPRPLRRLPAAHPAHLGRGQGERAGDGRGGRRDRPRADRHLDPRAHPDGVRGDLDRRAAPGRRRGRRRRPDRECEVAACTQAFANTG